VIRDKSVKFQLLLILFVVAIFIWSMYKPAGYLIWTMEVLPAIVIWMILLMTYNKFRLTSLSYIIIAILSILMFIGGHYTYSEVPLFNWIKDYFDLNRNHYDRFAHFLKGLYAIVIRELLIRKKVTKKGPWLISTVLSFALAIGAMYEIIEWLSTKITLTKKTATEFLGAQGDIWDAQWDMLLTFLGSILALLILSKVHNRLLENIIGLKNKKEPK
jgi:putative membrane protein